MGAGAPGCVRMPMMGRKLSSSCSGELPTDCAGGGLRVRFSEAMVWGGGRTVGEATVRASLWLPRADARVGRLLASWTARKPRKQQVRPHRG